MKEKRILVLYDIRGKQKYIYSSNKIQEIIGASLIIRDCFKDYLYPAAKKVSPKGIYRYKDGEKFSHEQMEKRFEEEGYIGETVYDGGGNFFVIYRDKEAYQSVNKIFYRDVLENTYTLQILTSYVEIENYDDYKGDSKRLRDLHKINEKKECAIRPVNALPIVQVNPQNSMPLEANMEEWKIPHKENLKLTRESAAKYHKYFESVDWKQEGETVLDRMVTEKGVDSHLAVIYIDGNNMGAKVQKETENDVTYDESINRLRRFSGEIQEKYITVPKEKIDEEFPSSKARRFVVSAGDEITFICNAKDAYRIVNTYFHALKDGCSSCAGVAIFHSHAPYAEAYRIAEECCEAGKTWMKKHNIEEACLMDFHYCQGAIGTSIEKIRQEENTEEMCCSWFLKEVKPIDWSKCSGVETKAEIEKASRALKLIAHGNDKRLLFAAKEGKTAFDKEIERICAHMPENTSEETKKSIQDLKEKRELVYRIMLVYDLWGESLTQNGEETAND